MKKTRILSVILVLALMLSMLPMTVLAADTDTSWEDEYTVTISFEGLTIGQGFYIEPVTYTLKEINDILGTSYTGNGDLMADQVTKALFTELGIDSELQGTWGDGTFYLEAAKLGQKVLDRPIKVPQILVDNGAPSTEDCEGGRGRKDWLGEFDYSFMAGWMITVDNVMIPVSAGAYPVEDGSVIRWRFTLWGYGADQGFNWMEDDPAANEAYFAASNMDAAYREYARLARNGKLTSEVKAAALETMSILNTTQQQADACYAALAAAGKPEPVEPEEPETPDEPRDPQDVSDVLNDALGQMYTTCTEPVFGSVGGEWTVLALARGGYLSLDDPYFESYYDRIVEYTNENILEGDYFHSAKSTENSRLICALSAIGRDSTNVGGHDLTSYYNNNFNWVKKQGINGPIWTLIAMDTWNFEATDATLRQQCIDFVLSKQTADGGWALSGKVADPDMTGMALQALANYRDQSAVEEAVQRGIACMSAMQKDNGGYASWGSINSESCAQIITACAALGINPDTDPRFVKNGSSVVDAILNFYNPDTKMFRHVFGQYAGGEDTGNAMATDQACYALVAYQRLLNGQNSLYDMTDVTPIAPNEPEVPDYPGKDLDGLVAYLNMTDKVSNQPGTKFPVKVDIQGWDNEGKYKLMDCIMNIPEPLEVESVELDDSRFAVGTLEWNVKDGVLRVAYADFNNNADLIKTGDGDVVPFFTVNMKVADTVDTTKDYKVTVGVSAMSVKLNSDSYDKDSQLLVDVQYAKDTVELCQNTDKPEPDKPDGTYTGTRPGTGFNFTTGILYKGDGIDLIPESKMAICVQITNLSQKAKLTFKPADGDAISFLYNEQVSRAANVNAYVAILDSSIDMEQFKNAASYTLMFDQKDIADCAITFGDTNDDTVVNAQDALTVVNAWLRKTDEVTDRDILHMNVNCDSRINTYDALGIMEHFVDGHEFAVVNKATTINSRVQQ